MNNGYVFVSDFFSDEILGGGELNDQEAISILSKKNDVIRIKSQKVDLSFLKKNIKKKFIISNFILLSNDCIKFLQENCKYIIYEHDHKYLVGRNPSIYPNFLAPKQSIINHSFYKNACSVFCQSGFHKNILQKNLQINNLVNLSGNLWSDDTLDILEKHSAKQKVQKASIMLSNIKHKNTKASVLYCEKKSIDYELIPSLGYHDFLSAMSNNDKLVFFPKTPETLSRIVVECRMMGMKVITNKLVGASMEPWFKLKGKDLILFMKNKKNDILLKIEEAFK
jgi:hypothetical protein|tara:strand:+ start:586 stop:1428 length:843 start_codon:yes stop_codon:yes gene_type:complete